MNVMASHVAFVSILQWLSLLLILSKPVNGQNHTITLSPTPTDEYAIHGKTVILKCTYVAGVTSAPDWYKDSEKLNSVITEHGLIIDDIIEEDSGMYSCRNGNASASVTLHVLPPSWIPQCEKTPDVTSITTGDKYTITCASTGDLNTALRWFVPDGYGSDSSNIFKDTKMEMTGTTVSISYSSTVEDASSQLLFICEAKLGSLDESCSVNFNQSQSNAIPFVVVGLMSLIALLLFFVVLFFLFRHRQCRFCQETMLEPNQILDANSLQTGAWIPPPVVAIDVDVVSEDEESVKGASYTYEDTEPVSQPPDVVPAQEPMNRDSAVIDLTDEAPVGQPETAAVVETAPVDGFPAQTKPRKKNLTITKNINQNVDKPTLTLEGKAVPVTASAIKPRPTQKREKKVIKHYKEPPVKARMKSPKEPIYAQVKKLNVPSKSVASKPADDTPSTSTGTETSPTQRPIPPPRPSSEDLDSKEASSTATGETDSTDQNTQLENDLGRGNSKKKKGIRHYRKKSEDKTTHSSQGDVVLNIQATKEEPSQEAAAKIPEKSSKTSKKTKKTKNTTPADRVIYAELDFSKDVGLNIQ